MIINISQDIGTSLGPNPENEANTITFFKTTIFFVLYFVSVCQKYVTLKASVVEVEILLCTFQDQ